MNKRLRGSADGDAASVRKQFEQTRDYRYVALAIGAAPFKPPKWAIEACFELHRRTLEEASSGNTPKLTGQQLDDVMRELFRAEDIAIPADKYSLSQNYVAPSLASAIKNVLIRSIGSDDPSFDANVRRLRRAWDHEARGVETDQSGFPQTERYRRILREWGDKNASRPWSQLPEQLIKSMTE